MEFHWLEQIVFLYFFLVINLCTARFGISFPVSGAREEWTEYTCTYTKRTLVLCELARWER